MDNTMFPFLILLAAIFVSRVINQKANKKLDVGKKAELVDLFTKKGLYTLGITILTLAFYFGNLRFQWISINIATSIFAIIFVSYILISRYTDYKKLKKHDFPDSYIKMYLLSSIIRFLGVILFFLFSDLY